MADEPHVIRGINWRETFPFTNIFRSFRLAIHPSKLVLALVALLVLYFGGRFLDVLWPRPVGEKETVDRLMVVVDRQADGQHRAEIVTRGEAAASYAALMADINEGKELSPGDARSAVKKRLDDDLKKAGDIKDANERKKAEKACYDAAVGRLYIVKAYQGQGPFAQFLNFESRCLFSVADGVRNLSFRQLTDSVEAFVVTGPSWLIRNHWVFAVIYLLLWLAVWAVFGGAIARIAAVHAARDEKLSVRQALRFSISKFWSFLSAPIIPIAIIFVVGVIVAIGGLVANIPWLGPILVGLLFFLAIAAGFVMALVGLGTIGGFNLMYPTIAVEGSDSFDAISRSFSYVYARPWRMLFYTIVALVYAAITYLFVRLFVYLTLLLVHGFAGWWIFTHAHNGQGLWGAMWPAPTFNSLPYDIPFTLLNGGESIGAMLVSIWVYLTIALLGAFVISMYFSANTVIYYLMRREVDATELDDVYLEQPEEEFAPVAPTATVAAEVPPTEASRVPAETPAPAQPQPQPEAPAAPVTPPPSENPPPATP